MTATIEGAMTYGEQLLREIQHEYQVARYHEALARWHERMAAGEKTEKPKRPGHLTPVQN